MNMKINMNMTRIVLAAAALLMALPAYAQRPRVSPHDVAGGMVQGEGNARARVTVYYGRPFAKGRNVWGEVVPNGKPWRLGADEGGAHEQGCSGHDGKDGCSIDSAHGQFLRR